MCITLSYKELEVVKAHHNQLNHKIASINLRICPGDRIGMYAVNHYEWAVANYAAVKAGLILVCINPAYQPRELSFALRHVGMRAIVSDTTYGRLPFSSVLSAAIQMGGVEQLEHVIFLDKTDFAIDGISTHQIGSMINDADSGDTAEMERRIASADFDSPCNIQFTSGTTGQPKAATLTHHNLINHGNFMIGPSDAESGRCGFLAQVPFFHSGGCSSTFSSMLNYGNELIIPMPHFDAMAGLKALKAYDHIAYISGVPTMYNDMLQVIKMAGIISN